MTNHPNRSRKTENTRWMSVSTPSVFQEIKIADVHAPTAAEDEEMDRLAALAERYGTHVETTTYRRG